MIITVLQYKLETKSKMKVKDMMTKKVITVRPTDTVDTVADILYKHHFTGIPVVDPKKKLLGLIAERDFIASDSKLYLPTYIKLLRGMGYVKNDKQKLPTALTRVMNAKAKDIMNKKIITAGPDMTIQQVAELFGSKRVNPIPVVNAAGTLLGIISRSDLIKLFSPKFINKKEK